MKMIFFQELYKNLIKEGFETINKFYENDILNEDTKYLALGKIKGNTLYVIIIFNMEKISISEIRGISNRGIKLFEDLQSKNKVGYTIISNVIIFKEENDKNNEVKDFISKLEPFSESNLNNIYWGYNVDKGKIILNENNPTKIINLREIIENTYISINNNDIRYTYEKSISCLKEIAKEEILDTNNDKFILTYGLIIINALVLVVTEYNGGSKNLNNLVRFGAIVSDYIIYNKEYYRLFTAIFIHSGITHFLYNSFSLYIFGTRVEKYYGEKKFIVIYLLSGMIAGISSVIFTKNVSVGASGAIFGLIGSITVMTSMLKEKLDGLDCYTMLTYIVISIGFGFITEGIDNFGHLGGLIAGVIISFIMCVTSKKKQRRDY